MGLVSIIIAMLKVIDEYLIDKEALRKKLGEELEKDIIIRSV